MMKPALIKIRLGEQEVSIPYGDVGIDWWLDHYGRPETDVCLRITNRYVGVDDKTEPGVIILTIAEKEAK